MANDDYRERMETMFAAVSDVYARYWHEYFHFAIFDDQTQSWEEAFQATHDKYMQALRVHQAANILEIACGRGAFADSLARHTQGQVLGIDISKSQLSHARQYERDNLRFEHHDVMALKDLDEKFDAIVCMDAACYFPDRRAAVRQIAGALRPGGRLLLIDWCKQEKLNRLQEELVLQPFMAAWAIAELETESGYLSYFDDAGLTLIEKLDLNDRTERNWNFGYERALQAVQELSYRDLPRMLWTGIKLGPAGIDLIKHQFAAGLYIKAGFDAGFLRYKYFLLENARR